MLIDIFYETLQISCQCHFAQDGDSRKEKWHPSGLHYNDFSSPK
jgi:hypothetical protein